MTNSAGYLYLHPDGKVRRHPVLRRRVRLRLAVTRRVDGVCCLLVGHGCEAAAAGIWRACGMWPKGTRLRT